MCELSSYGIHDILACYSRAILFVAVIYGRLSYIYIQTCINICFTIQNGWEARNILCFLCLSKLDALLASLCYYSSYDWKARMRTMILGGVWFFETLMMIRCDFWYDLWWRRLHDRVYDSTDRIGAWGLVDINLIANNVTFTNHYHIEVPIYYITLHFWHPLSTTSLRAYDFPFPRSGDTVPFNLAVSVTPSSFSLLPEA